MAQGQSNGGYEEHARRVREGLAKSTKYQSALVRMAERKAQLAHERKMKKLLWRGQRRSAWELICGVAIQHSLMR